MGSAAKATVWYGIAGHEIELPQAAHERAEADWFRDEGPVFRLFHCSDILMGFGVELHHHDWNDSPERLDLVAMAAQAYEAQQTADAILDELEVVGERGVYLLTDYS